MKKVLVLMLLIIILASCGKGYAHDEGDKELSYRTLLEGELYYIPHEHGTNDFTQKYKNFRTENPNLEVFDVEGDPNHQEYNDVRGYFIFTRLVE